MHNNHNNGSGSVRQWHQSWSFPRVLKFGKPHAFRVVNGDRHRQLRRAGALVLQTLFVDRVAKKR